MSDGNPTYPGGFKLAAALIGGWLLVVALALVTGSVGLSRLLILAGPTSAIAISIDMNGVHHEVAGWGSAPWAGGAFFLFLPIAPLYLYYRRKQLLDR